MTKQEWKKIRPEILHWDYVEVEWRCNWHRGHGWKKPNKVAHFRVFNVGDKYIDFDGRDHRMNYKAIVKITKMPGVVKDI